MGIFCDWFCYFFITQTELYSTQLDHREWSIVDQRIPISLPVSNSALNNPAWIPSVDGLNGSLVQIRRYSSFRAYQAKGK